MAIDFDQFQVTPRLPGRLALSVYDICLDSERPARADLKLADIYSIQVIVADKVTSECYRPKLTSPEPFFFFKIVTYLREECK